MYQYNELDQTLVNERASQFHRQTQRYLQGDLGEDEFRALRLMNGLYLQTHAPMLRVACPYGLLSAKQCRMLATIARQYDKGYAHITTRQNIQYNWPKLEQVPAILEDLASVQMSAIQTSGNCMRNTTSDPLAGVCLNETCDPRPYCEIIRQWTVLHPEFAYLPRKFKIAVSGAAQDRAATQLHDIGLYLVRNTAGEIGFRVLVGGGLGRTPIIGVTIRDFLPKKHLLSYLEAIVRVYNLRGRRDNKYKARIKILVKENGIEQFRLWVEEMWQPTKGQMLLSEQRIAEVSAHFAPPKYLQLPTNDNTLADKIQSNAAFALWHKTNTVAHKIAGYRAVYLSLKAPDQPPGDISHQQLDFVADIAELYSFGEVRTTHRQNLVLADVRQADLFALWQQLQKTGLATANIGTAADMICCPGLDFCSLANAGSIGIAREINQTIAEMDYLYDIGDMKLNISGCMNGCAHQSVGHIGILGVDKKGAEWYQITLGGSSELDAALGARLGPAIAKADIVQAINRILQTYLRLRQDDENFLPAVHRLGIAPFQEAVY